MKMAGLIKKNLVVAGISSAFVLLSFSFTWAAVSFVKPQDASYQIEMGKKNEIPTKVSSKTRTHAPEPSSLALFGSGIMGMILSFLRATYAAVKRIFDIFVSLVGLILSSPLMLLTAILIKLTSRGPILYSQIRVGREGEHFKIYKFRTMRVDAEKETGPVWAATNDRRLTPIGKFLRKAHIDEIPQLINVIRGEMSIIGPRPERPVFVDQFRKQISDYEKRLVVKPGITGLAQVWHRYDETIEDVKKKIKYDLLYIKKQCMWTDMQILLRTVLVVLTGEGAK